MPRYSAVPALVTAISVVMLARAAISALWTANNAPTGTIRVLAGGARGAGPGSGGEGPGDV